MKKKLAMIIMAVAVGASAGLTGCVEETAVQVAPDMSKKENVQLDFVQLHNDTLEAFGDEDVNPYRFITDLNITGDNDTKTVNIEAICLDDTDKATADQFATAVIRRVNDAAAIQSTEFEFSNQDSFGTFFDKYTLNIQIKPESTRDDPSTYLVNESIAPGEEIPFDTDYETYEEGYVDILDSMANEPAVIDLSGDETESAGE